MSNDLRFRDVWQKVSSKEFFEIKPAKAGVIVSYPDDEGVRNNKGRAGASQGPDRILFHLGKLVYREEGALPVFVIKDIFRSKSLRDRHEKAERLVKVFLEKGYKVVCLGGGHDYGYPDASAYKEVVQGKVLNVDAHLDVRPVVKGRINSGTPFRRWLERFSGKDLIQWGIQEHVNLPSHYEFCLAKKVKILSYREPMPTVKGPLGLSVCLDAFEGIRGVSAPAVVGLHPQNGLALVERYRGQSQWMGIYESAPRHDPINEDSARFGARLVAEFFRGGK